MPDITNEGERKMTPLEAITDLSQRAESSCARSRAFRNDLDYQNSLGEAMASIGFSTRLMCFLFGMDERLLARPWYLEELGNTTPLQVSREDTEDIKTLTRIAGELFGAADRALKRWIEQST